MLKNIKTQTGSIENFIKRYRTAITQRNKDLRITVEEAGLIISEITELLSRLEEKADTTPQKKEEETIRIEFDAGSFKKQK